MPAHKCVGGHLSDCNHCTPMIKFIAYHVGNRSYEVEITQKLNCIKKKENHGIFVPFWPDIKTGSQFTSSADYMRISNRPKVYVVQIMSRSQLDCHISLLCRHGMCTFGPRSRQSTLKHKRSTEKKCYLRLNSNYTMILP